MDFWLLQTGRGWDGTEAKAPRVSIVPHWNIAFIGNDVVKCFTACCLSVERRGLQPKWDVADVLLQDFIGVSVSAGICEVTNVDPTAEPACFLITLVVIVIPWLPSSVAAGKRPGAPRSSPEARPKPGRRTRAGVCFSEFTCWHRLLVPTGSPRADRRWEFSRRRV